MATDTIVGWSVLALVVVVGIAWVILESVVGSKHEREQRQKKVNQRITKTKRGKHNNGKSIR